MHTIGTNQLIERLHGAIHCTDDAIVAFDADGTLWSGDVADDVFLHCVHQGLLRDEALLPLMRFAEHFGVGYPAGVSTSELARLLFDAFQNERVPERDTYGMMAWCYAGFRTEQLKSLTSAVLDETQWRARINAKLVPVLDWMRASDLQPWIVSASPTPLLEVAASNLGFAASSLIGTLPATVAGTITARLAGPVPYGSRKVTALRERIGSATLVAAFGDSPFDLELLTAASFGVAVNPKPELLSALADRPSLIVLA